MKGGVSSVNREESQSQINYADILQRFWKTLRRMFVLVPLLAVVFACVFFVRAKHGYVPKYESRAVFSVTSGASKDDILSYSYYYNNSAASQMAESFPYILETDMMRDLIRQCIGKEYINGTITASSVADTNMFILTVRSTVPQDAYDILKAVMESWPKVAVYMTENARLVIREAPAVPDAPYNSVGWKGAAAKGAVIGVVLALAVILLIAIMRKTVNSTEDMKKEINLPVLATFPQLSNKKRRSGKLHDISRENGFEEGMRGLRVKLLKSLEAGKKVIMVTGTIAGEGKTTISVGLARSLAADGKRVVLVDADLRKQGTRELLKKQNNAPGLLEFLEQESLQSLQCCSAVMNESFDLVNGNALPQKRYVIEFRRLAAFIAELKKRYDYIVLDCPPCGEVSDTGVLCQQSDGILYVIKQDYAPTSRIMDGLQSLYSKDGKVIGVAFNGVSGHSQRYGYGYGYGRYGYGKYGYGKYGYGKTKGKE